MTPVYYMDVHIKDASAGAFVPGVFSQLIRVLHQFLADNPQAAALALPEARSGNRRRLGSVARLFAETSDTLGLLADSLEAHSLCSEHIIVSRIKSVPGHVDQWVTYKRWRFPSKRKTIKRAAAFDIAEKMPLLAVRSSSNPGQPFTVGVAIDVYEQKPEQSSGQLNGYGLSRMCSPVWLPVLPS